MDGKVRHRRGKGVKELRKEGVRSGCRAVWQWEGRDRDQGWQKKKKNQKKAGDKEEGTGRLVFRLCVLELGVILTLLSQHQPPTLTLRTTLLRELQVSGTPQQLGVQRVRVVSMLQVWPSWFFYYLCCWLKIQIQETGNTWSIFLTLFRLVS